MYRIKGGARILAYELTVILGSIPFVLFLTWRAQGMGLTKRSAFLLALIMCGDVMLFPWALRSGWIIIWIMSIIILIISGTLWSEVQKYLTKEKASALKIEVNTVSVTIEALPAGQSIDELIDLGFKEKDSENLEPAAAYFSQALSLDPKPDLAFYLIIDCYWLWNNLGRRSYALTQLQGYVQKYLPQFDTQLRDQFKAWMIKEDLNKMFD